MEQADQHRLTVADFTFKMHVDVQHKTTTFGTRMLEECVADSAGYVAPMCSLGHPPTFPKL